ncbi:MmgE/PrpD family protein [Halovenus marina]|uniref:MmgE/PrpD family protein n=1 Tax=Halovenus marina TaxID=3396621 RepID=UPI003F54C028
MTTESTSAMAALARRVDSLADEELAPETVTDIERAFVDTVGVTYGGLADGAGARVVRIHDTEYEQGRVPEHGQNLVRVPGTDIRTTPTDGAFVIGTAAHALDFDDSVPSIPAHVSCVVVPAILSVGSRVDASGRDAIVAYLAGYETVHALGEAGSPGHYDRGWHPTGTLGGFGAAAASAALLGLDREETANALGLAASMASGLRANYGSDGKPMHAGLAARSGVTAALAAREGATATTDALTDDHGFFDLYGDGRSLEDAPPLELDLDGRAFPRVGLFRKQYPCCHCAHAAIAAVSSIVAERDLAPESVGEVRVLVSEMGAAALDEAFPTTADEARFSLPYLLGRAVLDGAVGFGAFEPDAYRDPAVRTVAERVRMDVDESRETSSLRTTVELTTTAGETVRREDVSPPGSPDSPMSEAALREKFENCRQRLDDADRSTAVESDAYQSLRALSKQPSIRALVEDL